MRPIYLCITLVIVFVNVCHSGPEIRYIRSVATYSSKYDSVDVDAILASTRLLNNYVSCLLDKRPCTPDGQFLKQHIADALATECSKCNKKQKEIAGKLLAHLLQDHKDYWNQLIEKYDKTGSFRKKYEGFTEGELEDYSDLDEARRK